MTHPPNNVPLQLSSFIGREHELAELRLLLSNTRLLTLTGAGEEDAGGQGESFPEADFGGGAEGEGHLISGLPKWRLERDTSLNAEG